MSFLKNKRYVSTYFELSLWPVASEELAGSYHADSIINNWLQYYWTDCY